MECFHPYEIVQNGFTQQVRCGHCLSCLAHRQAEWTSRLRIELEADPEKCYFVTLTYNDDNLPTVQPDLSCDPVPAVSKRDVQLFHMAIRKRVQQGFFTDDTLYKCGLRSLPDIIKVDPETRFRYYLTSEYGPNGNRPHYHGFYVGLPEDGYLTQVLLENSWHRGFVSVERARSEAAAAYVAKYLVNDSLVKPLPGAPRPFALMSKGLGAAYLENDRLVRWHTMDPARRSYIPLGDSRAVLPRYLRDRILIDQETGEDLREELRKDTELRNQARQDFEDSLSREELLRLRDEEYHREQELKRQAIWRFKKNGKLK